MSRYLHLQGIIIKRHNFGDAHRFVTLFTDTHGKVSAIAKGVRKLKSTKRASLEPFNHVQLSLVKTHDHHLITETRLINSFPHLRSDISHMSKAYQALEILDLLTAELETHPQLYHQTLRLLEHINAGHPSRQAIIDTVCFMLEELGFGLPADSRIEHLKAHIESISEKPLRTRQFLLESL